MAKFAAYMFLELMPAILLNLILSVTPIVMCYFGRFNRPRYHKLMSNLAFLGSFLFKDVLKRGNTDHEPQQEPSGNRDRDDKLIICIHGRRIPDSVISLFGIIALSTSTFAVLTFWDTFLFKKSFACDPGLDCFPDDAGLDADPVQNCSQYIMDENTTVTCYTLALEFGKAAGIAGGLFTAANIVLTVIAFVMLKLYEKYREGRGRCCVIIVQIVIVIASVVAIPIGTFLFTFLLDYISRLSFSTYCQAFSLLTTTVLTISVPWGWVIKSENSYEDL